MILIVLLSCSKCYSKDMVGMLMGLQQMGYSPSRRWMRCYLSNVAEKQKQQVLDSQAKRTILQVLEAMGWSAADVQEALIAAM
jgi:hypothetical protein